MTGNLVHVPEVSGVQPAISSGVTPVDREEELHVGLPGLPAGLLIELAGDSQQNQGQEAEDAGADEDRHDPGVVGDALVVILDEDVCQGAENDPQDERQ